MIAGDNVAEQHRLLVCRMTLETKKRKTAKAQMVEIEERRPFNGCEEFREKIRGLWAVRKSYRIAGQLRPK